MATTNTIPMSGGISNVALVRAIKGEIDKRVGGLSPAQLAVWNEWIMLSEDGHAVLLDWVDANDGKTVERIQLHHYLTCKVCLSRKVRLDV